VSIAYPPRPPMRPFSFLLLLVLPSCTASSDPGDAKVPTTLENAKSDAKEPTSSGDSTGTPKVPTTSDKPSNGGTSEPNFACRLPSPVPSEDTCTKDADCAPSVPCHARACVAASKATPRTPDIMCSMNIDCQSADVNPCSCYQGHCALVPKNP